MYMMKSEYVHDESDLIRTCVLTMFVFAGDVPE